MRLALFTLMLCAAPALAAAPGPEGVWRTGKGPKGGSMNVRVAPCQAGGAELCGNIVQIFDMTRTDFIGVVLIRDMAPGADGVWTGEIWSPDKQTAYTSHMRMDGADLEVEGCMLAICKSQTWTRVE